MTHVEAGSFMSDGGVTIINDDNLTINMTLIQLLLRSLDHDNKVS